MVKMVSIALICWWLAACLLYLSDTAYMDTEEPPEDVDGTGETRAGDMSYEDWDDPYGPAPEDIYSNAVGNSGRKQRGKDGNPCAKLNAAGGSSVRGLLSIMLLSFVAYGV